MKFDKDWKRLIKDVGILPYLDQIIFSRLTVTLNFKNMVLKFIPVLILTFDILPRYILGLEH